MATAMQAWNAAEAAAWAQYQADSLAAEQAWAASADAAMVEYYADEAAAETIWNTDEATYSASLAADVANAESAWYTDEASAFAAFEAAVGSEAGDYRQTLDEPWTVSQVTETLAAANPPDARQLAAAAAPNQRAQQPPPPPTEQAPGRPNVGRAGEAIQGLFDFLRRAWKGVTNPTSLPTTIPQAVKDLQRAGKGADEAIRGGEEGMDWATRVSHGWLPGDKPSPGSGPSSGQSRRQGPTP